MSAKYLNREDSEIYGSRLIIFQRDDLDGDTFHFRAKIIGHKGYIRRSCKTSNTTRAMLFAENAYEDLMVRAKGGFALKELTIEKFFKEWIERKRHNFTETRFKWKVSVYERYLTGYFGFKKISDLTKKYADGYWNYRLKFWNSVEGEKRIKVNATRVNAKSISSNNVAKVASFATLKAEASLINEILTACVDEGHLARTIKVSAQDAMTKSERGDGYRDTFTEDEWRVLSSNLYNYAFVKGKWTDKRVNSWHRLQRRMLHTFVVLAASTGMRVGEIKQLTWGDISYRALDGENRLVVAVRGETSKVRRSRSVVAHSTHTNKVIENFRKITKFSNQDSLIFYSKRKGKVGTLDLSVSFKNFLQRCEYQKRDQGLRISKDGKSRTLYSLRHFYAIQRLKQSVDICRLAENMGTGITQIKNHYGRHVSGEAFMRELTKNEKRSTEMKKRESIKQLMDMIETGLIDEHQALESFKRLASSN